MLNIFYKEPKRFFCQSHHKLALLSLLLFSFMPQAAAHATIVLGTLSTEPAVLSTGESFKLKIDMVDPSQTPIEDAWVLAEFRPEDAALSDESIEVRFEEVTNQKGTYVTELSLPQTGNWQLLLRDQTFRQEEATASLTFPLINNTQVEPINFIFPPTVTTNAVRTWLIWLIALPILAGIIVTIIVLRQSPSNTQENTLASGKG